MNSSAQQTYFLSAMGLLIAVASVVLLTWEQSPYSHYLHHGQFGQVNLDNAICRVFEAGVFQAAVVLALLFIAGWTLMIVAMMHQPVFHCSKSSAGLQSRKGALLDRQQTLRSS